MHNLRDRRDAEQSLLALAITSQAFYHNLQYIGGLMQ